MDIAALQRKIVASDIAPERLAGNDSLSKEEKIAEASRQFEAVLLRQILENTQKTVIHSKYTSENMSSAIYRDQITSQLADSISKSGEFGLAKTFQQQLTRPTDLVSKDTATKTDKPVPQTHTPPAEQPVHRAPIQTRSCSAYFQFPKP